MSQNIQTPLNLDQLQIAFRLYGIGTGMAIFVFVTENIIKMVTKIGKGKPGASARTRISAWK